MSKKILIDEDAVREALGGLRYSRDSTIIDEDYQRFNCLCRNLEHALRKAELTPIPANKITLPEWHTIKDDPKDEGEYLIVYVGSDNKSHTTTAYFLDGFTVPFKYKKLLAWAELPKFPSED